MKLGIPRLSGAIAVLLALGLPAVAGSLPTLTLSPVGGALTGNPGDTVGWGFTLYDNTDFAVVTSSDSVPAASATPRSMITMRSQRASASSR